ncbi:hypothetical protein [Sphingobacterium pedocola]|nr:hypothetical protein [Sphingobacterium pedocola]
MPEVEDLTLTLGGRKRKIKRSDFDQFAMSLGIAEQVRDNIYKDFSVRSDQIQDWINKSFLNGENKDQYFKIIIKKMHQIGL